MQVTLMPNPTVESTHDESLNEGDQVSPKEHYQDKIDGNRKPIDIITAENPNGGGQGEKMKVQIQVSIVSELQLEFEMTQTPTCLTSRLSPFQIEAQYS
jgi:hypothetical protein